MIFFLFFFTLIRFNSFRNLRGVQLGFQDLTRENHSKSIILAVLEMDTLTSVSSLRLTRTNLSAGRARLTREWDLKMDDPLGVSGGFTKG